MVFEAGGSRVLAAWKVEVLSLCGFFVLHCLGV